jgi:hypothetical protein
VPEDKIINERQIMSASGESVRAEAARRVGEKKKRTKEKLMQIKRKVISIEILLRLVCHFSGMVFSLSSLLSSFV